MCSPWTAVGNAKFIARMRRDKAVRAQFSAALLAYYLGLNLITDLPIPPTAYTPGIVYAALRWGR